MRRRTKIVATLGPASERRKTLRKMIMSGLDVARLNFSHGSADEHRERARSLRAAAEECGRDIGLLGDLQGPKIRVMRFKKGSVHLRAGDSFFLDSQLGLNDGSRKGVGVALETLHEDVKPGDTLLLNDGLISLQVDSVEGTRIHTTVIDGGILSDHKGINLKGGGLSAPALTDVDRENIRLAAELGIDFLAVSFVRSGADIEEARRLFEEAGGTGQIVARGDLGVEMGYAGLTGIQKKLIRKTRKAHKIVITATQMMESMIENPIPTRAEVSDVANAVIDGTDAVMLSGETAVGKHPNKTMDVRAIIALTESGSTTRWMSRVRSDIPIYALTPHKSTSRRVALYRGVYPVEFGIDINNPRSLYQDIFTTLLERNYVEVGDMVIFTKGDLDGVSGSTNAMKILRVTEGSS